MDREIKFRIWLKKSKRMLYDSGLCFKGCKILEEIGTKVMQFTGLKDKNKKDIFEGDIIRFENQIFKVESWLAEFIIRQVSGIMKGTGDSITAEKSEYEVIGNIYEDITLLQRSAK